MGLASSVRRCAALVFYNIVATLVLLLVLEGIASVVYFFHRSFGSRPTAERLHTEYDRELGWVNLPNVYLPNMYGPGRYLRTNSQRFRNNADFTTRVPPGKTRIICSGNSHTLGFGVDNDHTWPQLLATSAPNVETVNMGQGGYGADQSYLWYKRDGVALDHNIQILALMSADLYRMQTSSFAGYGKPVLVIENDHLVTKNVPVPRQGWSPGLRRGQDAMNNLHITRFLRSALRREPAPATTQAEKEHNEVTLRVLSHLLDDLAARNRAKNSALVLAYLPTRGEEGEDVGTPWRKFLAEYTRQRGLLYLDLTDDFRRLPPEELDKLFMPQGAVDFPGAAGHYSEAGNAFVADLIYRRLAANPETAAQLHTQPASDATLRPVTTLPR